MRVYSPDDFSGEDTDRVQRTVDAAIQTYGRAYFPWKGRPYEIEETITLEPMSNDDQTTLIMEGDPTWKLFEYHGPPRSSVFKSLGLKRSTLRNIAVRCFASQTIGFDIAGDSKTGSSSGNLLENLRFQSEAHTQGNTGFSVGRGGNDHSGNVFSRCSVEATVGGIQQEKAFLKLVHEAGHTGFSFVGGNTLAQSLRDCTGFAQRVLFKNVVHDGYPSGGSKTSYDNCAGTGCCLGFWVDGGMGVQIRGGRWELCGALIVHGSPLSGGRGETTVLLSGVTCDAFFPVSASKCGLFEAGEVIGIRSDADVVIQSCDFSTDTIGDLLDGRAVRLSSNSSKEAVLHLQGNRGLPAPVATSQGLRKIVVDGQSRSLKSNNAG